MKHIGKFININHKKRITVLESESGEIALEMVEKYNPEVIILDIMLPGIDGFEVCKKIRQSKPEVIIIMLTARGQDLDKITGLELGADDYMVKPFNPLELVARIKTILRRAGNIKNNNEQIIFKNLILDLKSQRFLKDGIEIELTHRFSIIKMFYKITW